MVPGNYQVLTLLVWISLGISVIFWYLLGIILFLECNHKTLGPYYIYTPTVIGISGSTYSLVLRLELYGSGNRVVCPENQYFYNLVYTVHGILMIFYLVIPVLYGGLGNYMVPVYQGVGEVGFPRHPR